ncbi:MAG: helix-turn-helix domain-containing protein [Candidatus Omnitrophica bacterium]|nr:helix-turn-helix domain-containing protein [Candidatus Omnitrophota bacterium]
MISISDGGTINANWVQNGVRHQKKFKSMQKAEEYMEVVEEVQNSIKLCEEMDKFNRNFEYDPKLVNLKIYKIFKEVNQLKESISVKNKLQKKLGVSVKKLSEQPRNVIDKRSFMNEINGVRKDIENLDRFFKEHAIILMRKEILEAVQDMKRYYKHQRELIKETRDMFKDAQKSLFEKTSSIMVKDRVLSIREVAQYLGISYGTVREMMLRGKLPYFRVGRRYRVKEPELKKWMEKRRGAAC